MKPIKRTDPDILITLWVAVLLHCCFERFLSMSSTSQHIFRERGRLYQTIINFLFSYISVCKIAEFEQTKRSYLSKASLHLSQAYKL